MRMLIGFLSVSCYFAMATAGVAAEEATDPSIRPQSQGVLFTKPLLSETEQAEYRARVRAAKDEEGRERIRAEHYELMKARAKERGYALSEQRPATTGVNGDNFGPQLIGEDQRAAQRAKLRGEKREQVWGPSGLAPDEATEKMPRPPRQQPESEMDRRAGVAIVDDAAKAHSASPAARPQARLLAAPLTLPGIESIFGPQLMTEEEKSAFRARLRRANSDDERQAIRAERDQQIGLRAREKGLTLPQ